LGITHTNREEAKNKKKKGRGQVQRGDSAAASQKTEDEKKLPKKETNSQTENRSERKERTREKLETEALGPGNTINERRTGRKASRAEK